MNDQPKCKCGSPVVAGMKMCASCWEAWRKGALAEDAKLDAKPACDPKYTAKLGEEEQ